MSGLTCTEPDRKVCPRLCQSHCNAREELMARAERLVQFAALEGQVLTIEQVPLQPLAMGHYETVVHVRRARGKS